MKIRRRHVIFAIVRWFQCHLQPLKGYDVLNRKIGYHMSFKFGGFTVSICLFRRSTRPVLLKIDCDYIE